MSVGLSIVGKKKTRNNVFEIKRISTDHMGELDPDKKVKLVCERVFND